MDKAKCGAKAKSMGKSCQNPAGFKTDHVETSRGFLHGGKTAIKTGCYSFVRSRRIVEWLEAVIGRHGAIRGCLIAL